MATEKIHQDNWRIPIVSDYISEFVYGGIDGAITTFAVVAGAAGAHLDLSIVLILGFANLIADGFSMSVGNYFATKADRDNYDKHKATEEWEIIHLPEVERREVEEIFENKGFSGDLLQQVVDVIISDPKVWVDTMMVDELGMIKDNKKPVHTALVTFLSFNIIGIIPLLAYLIAGMYSLNHDNLFTISCISTGLALLLIGRLKSAVTQQNTVKGMLETLTLGGLAAALAYIVGHLLEAAFS